ncbi:MAG TPA: hypothetical protein VLF89_08395, partial [Candidatus Saccharimonadales bacterium]|nr:hypothetical protein [Candidatus Saccharimonadales bacterium]
MQITDYPEWKALKEHFEKVKDLHLRQLFADDPKRGETFSLQFEDIFFDYSKNRITKETLDLLLKLPIAVKLQEAIEAMFTGQ